MSAVTAVVVTYNRRELLRQCLDALNAQTVGAPDIWVIDNASTDGTGKMVASLERENIHYCNTGKNLGGAGGFSWGIYRAAQEKTNYLWVMDDDCIPQPDALEKLLAADASMHGQYGWLSSRALAPDGTDQPMNRQRRTPYRDIENYEGERIPAVMASFVALFLPIETVRKYGLPIAEFFIWSDDWEYTRRISRELPCYVIPDSRVIHAMRKGNVVNIAADEPERWPRYRYFYRNDVYLYRREGIQGWLWLIAKDVWHSIQVLMHGPQKGKRLVIIWKGFFAGIRFHPQLRGIDEAWEIKS
ncbi:MAG: glycosyltransferase family 2 protein [Oscillospiraceae bacterium]|nr:glycosyltransferase family 2 protein [Oscillospiraceae bacterium]